MDTPRTLLILLVVVLLSAGAATAQSFNSGKNRKTYKGLKAVYPHHGFGFKLGDPFALTYKFYGSENFSFAIDFGTPASGLYNRYFRQKFNGYISTDTFRTSNASIGYVSHKVSSDLTGEAKFLYHIELEELSPGLQLYAGAGWEWKDTNIAYTYQYTNAGQEPSAGQFRRRRLTMGPQLIGGLEYSSTKIPVAAFLEIEYYKDVQIDPSWYRFEGGVGLRYLF